MGIHLLPAIRFGLLTLGLASSAYGQTTFEACGTLISTSSCTPVFQLDGSTDYMVLQNYGSFQVGDRVHVIGSLQSCRTACLTGTCVLANSIDSCAACNCTVYCAGSGSGVACPCANPGGAASGCGNSVDALGAELTALGGASLSDDEMVLLAWRMPDSTAVLFQGPSSTETLFGDGKLCVGTPHIRLATRTNSNGSSRYPVVGEPRLATIGHVTTPGTRYYQVWYRDDAAFCTSANHNLTNGIRLDWAP